MNDNGVKGKLNFQEYQHLTMESMNYSSKNKENLAMDRDKEQELVSRLYRADKYKHREIMKKIQDEKREREEMNKCTFKPDLTNNRLRSASANKRGSSINGYEKTVNRMKVGIERTRI